MSISSFFSSFWTFIHEFFLCKVYLANNISQVNILNLPWFLTENRSHIYPVLGQDLPLDYR